nr:MAG TPA: portal protein [Caudoviricetes sp.]
MDFEEIKETDVWNLYLQAQMYARQTNIYESTDKNFRMYNGDQWAGLKLKGIEPVQLNFIKPIINYKVGAISQNLWAIHYSAENIDIPEFVETARKTCELLNKKAAKIWEVTYMDYMVRQICKNAAINGECPIYINFNESKNMPEIEVLNKTDIYFGNENHSDIQKQPYILLKKRMPVSLAKVLAEENGASKQEIQYILGDQETFEEAGESAKEEKDNMVTVVWKLWKENKNVYMSIATRYCNIKENENTGLSLYPVTHMIWEEKQGSARGAGEITVGLIANQIEVNKTLMRRALVAKNTAYPQKVVNIDKIQNPSALNEVGGIIKVSGMGVQNVQDAFTNINPAQMSSDVERLQQDLIQTSRELASASQAASGDVDAEEASGRAILAVQQASQQPLVEQLGMIKKTIEDIARIELDMLKTYSEDGLEVENEVQDPTSGQTTIQLEKIDGIVLKELQATVKVDITPKSAYDKYAQERSIENLFIKGMFNPQMLGQLKFYLECLDDDSVMPKQKLLERVDKELEKQSRIAEIQAQGQQLIAQQQQFYNMDPDSQATTMMKQKLINQIKEDYASRQDKIKQTEEDLNEENNQEENA